MIKFIRTSPLTDKENVRTIDVTQDEYDAWRRGTLIQEAMPRASAEDREFILTGYTPEDWAEMFPPEEEDFKNAVL